MAWHLRQAIRRYRMKERVGLFISSNFNCRVQAFRGAPIYCMS